MKTNEPRFQAAETGTVGCPSQKCRVRCPVRSIAAICENNLMTKSSQAEHALALWMQTSIALEHPAGEDYGTTALKV